MTTYMIYSHNGEGLQTIVGPVFKAEIENAKEKWFSECVDFVNVLEENVFENRFKQWYQHHIHMNWFDKLVCYIAENVSWIGDSYKSTEPLGLAGSWYHIYEVFVEGVRHLQININVTANRFHTARLCEDIRFMFQHMHLRVGTPYYTGNDQKIHLGTTAGGVTDEKSGAYQRYLAEKAMESACLV